MTMIMDDDDDDDLFVLNQYAITFFAFFPAMKKQKTNPNLAWNTHNNSHI